MSLSHDTSTWLHSLKKEVPSFLHALRGQCRKGFYQYSLSGDVLSDRFHWGLGNSAFFLKCMYTLGRDMKDAQEIGEAVSYIQSFAAHDGTYSDPFVRALSFPLRVIGRAGSYQETLRAQTRQAISALAMVGEKPKYVYQDFCQHKKDIDTFIQSLDWGKPWHAASHVSHQLFFIEHATLSDAEKHELLKHWLQHIAALQQPDGSWHKEHPSLQQKINGAMKIITGLRAVDRVSFAHPEALIDLCLSATHDAQACDNFNIVFVLKYANELTKGVYRKEEIASFMHKRLDLYRTYYHPKQGGFSFHPAKANRFYYGAYISRGKAEPDVHGTVLFLWGVSLILQVLGLEDEYGFREVVA